MSKSHLSYDPRKQKDKGEAKHQNQILILKRESCNMSSNAHYNDIFESGGTEDNQLSNNAWCGLQERQ